MREFSTIIELSKDVKNKINTYNVSEPSQKAEAYNNLSNYVKEIMSNEKHRAMIYRGNGISTVFEKTLGRWRIKIWKELVDKI